MANELKNGSEESATSLVGGIINDFQDLLTQQATLIRHEVEEDIHKGMAAAAFFALGVGLFFLGSILLVFGLAHLLHWFTSQPGIAPEGLPLWSCYTLVGIFLLIPGTTLVLVGRKKFQTINPLQSEANQALQENLEWTTTPK